MSARAAHVALLGLLARLPAVGGSVVETLIGGALEGVATSTPMLLDTSPMVPLMLSGDDVLFSEFINARVRRLAQGNISTIAGTGSLMSIGDNGDALQAGFIPAGLVGGANGYFISDANCYVRFVNATGFISSPVGSGACSYWGDGEPAILAAINKPTGLAYNSGTGDLYVSDTGNNVIRAVDATGIIRTYAGGGATLGDSGAATSAKLVTPLGIAFDPSSNALYIADSGQHRVRKVQGGIIHSIAGVGVPANGGDSGPATLASLYSPSSVCLGASGSVLVADRGNNRLRRVRSDGVIENFAGQSNGAAGTAAGDGGPATLATLYLPSAVVWNASSGDTIIVDGYNNCIRSVSSTGNISTVAGVCRSSYELFDGVPATSASLGQPSAVAMVYSTPCVVESWADSVRCLDEDSNMFTLAGYFADYGYSGDGGGASFAIFRSVFSASVANDLGLLLLADAGNDRLRAVNLSAGEIFTIAGTGVTGYNGDGQPATAAALNTPYASLYVPLLQSIFIADGGNNRVRRVSANGTIFTFAGIGIAGYSGDGRAATSANLDRPVALAWDDVTQVLYIVDSYNNLVRAVDMHGRIWTVAGTGDGTFYGDFGPATSAALNSPYGIAVDALSGDVYIADTFNGRVRRIHGDTSIIETLAGTGAWSFNGDGLAGTATALAQPLGVAFDPITSRVLIADTKNNRVRGVQLPQESVAIRLPPPNVVGVMLVRDQCIWNATSDVDPITQAIAASFQWWLVAVLPSGTDIITLPCAPVALTAHTENFDPTCVTLAVVSCTAPMYVANSWRLGYTVNVTGSGAEVFVSKTGIPVLRDVVLARVSPTGAALVNGTNYFPLPNLPATVSYNGRPCDNVTVLDDTALVASCPVNDASLYWRPALLQVNISGILAPEVQLTPLAIPAAPTLSPSNFSWGDVVTLTAPYLGQAAPSTVAFTVVGSGYSFPCTNLTVVSTDAITCAPAPVPISQQGTVNVTITIDRIVFTVRDVVGAVTASGTLGGMAAPFLLPASGGGVVNFTLNAPMPNASDYTAARLATPVSLNSFRVFVPGAAAGACTYTPGSLVVQCTAPAHGGAAVPWQLEVCAMFNVSTTSSGQGATLVYSPPVLSAVTPSVVLLPPSGAASAPLAFVITAAGLSQNSAWQSMMSFSVGGAPCVLALLNASTATCGNWSVPATGAVWSAQLAPNRVALPVSFMWAGEPVFEGTVVGVQRPIVASVVPLALPTASSTTITISGADLCPPPVCTSTADVRVFVANYPCIGTVVVNSSAIACTAPAVPITDAIYPQLPIVVQNSVAANSTDTVTVFYPPVVTSANATVFVAKVHSMAQHAACYWDPTNSTSPYTQAIAAGWSFALRVTVGAGASTPFHYACGQVQLSAIGAPAPATCVVAALLTCVVSPPLDGGAGWQLVTSYAGAEWVQSTGPTVSVLPYITDSQLTWPFADESIALLSLVGGNFAFDIRGAPLPTLAWLRDANLCDNVTVVNSTLVQAQCRVAADTSVLYWAPRLLSLAILNANATTVTQPVLPRPPVAVTPTIVSWGSTITLNSTAIGAPPPAIVLVYAVGVPASAQPCVNVTALNDDAVSCTLRIPDGRWYNQPLALSLQFPLSNSQVVLSPNETQLYFTPPSLASVSIPRWLQPAGGDMVYFTLPQSDFTHDSYGSATGLTSLVAWISGSPLQACAAVSSSVVACRTPPGLAAFVSLTLQLAGRFNMTTILAFPGSSYLPPSVTAVVPAAMLLPGPGVNVIVPVLRISLSQSLPDVSALQHPILGNASCTTLTAFNASTLVCNNWNASVQAAALASGPDVASLAFRFDWGGATFSSASMVTAFVRPQVVSTTPRFVQAGTLITVSGTNLCPAGLCSGGGQVTVLVGMAVCAGVNVLTPSVVSCTVPAMARGTPGYPVMPVTVCNALGACSSAAVAPNVSYPTTQYVSAASALPTQFIPSDASAPVPLTPSVSVHIVNDDGSVASNAVAVCTLSSGTLASTVTTTLGSAAVATTGQGGVAEFPPVIVTTTFAVMQVLLVVSCTLGGASAALAPVEWTVDVIPLSVQFCIPPPTVTQAQLALPAWSVGLYHPLVPGSPCSAGAGTGSAAIPVPAVQCSVSVANTRGSTAILQHASEPLGTTLTAEFTETILLAVQGSTTQLAVACSLGAIAVPPVLQFNLTLQGCPAGSEPVGFFCNKCPTSYFSLGGASTACTACPHQGAVCTGGVLQLLPAFYRASSEWGQPLGADSHMFPCFNAEACTLNATSLQYGCLTGYTGPLCGVCDVTADYAAFGGSCRPCWPKAANASFTFVAVFVVLLLLAFVAGRKRGAAATYSRAGVVLKILLAYTQQIGSLQAFKANGTAAFHSAVSWTDSVSASPLSAPGFECLFRWSYATRYVLLVTSPLVAALAILALSLLLVCARAVRVLPRPWCDVSRLRLGLAAMQESRRLTSSLLFVLLLAYMPIVSGSLRALDCFPDSIDGQYYLRADLSVNCSAPEYLAVRALAICVLLLVGCGLPLVLITSLARVSYQTLHDPAFQEAYGLLFQGYKVNIATTPSKRHRRANVLAPVVTDPAAPAIASRRSYVWWEGMVLLRKALIAVIAVLVTDALTQVACAILLFGVFARLQQTLRPYAEAWLNSLELLSLTVSCGTAILCALVADSNASDDSASTTGGMSPQQLATTVVLVAATLGTFALLAGVWLRLQLHSTRRVLHGMIRRANDSKSARRMSITTAPASGVLRRVGSEPLPHSADPPHLVHNPLRSVQ